MRLLGFVLDRLGESHLADLARKIGPFSRPIPEG
jgi:hypothetical protein